MVQEFDSISDKDILDVLKSIKYGSVEITIHDSKVVQVERKEKLRVAKPGNSLEKKGQSK